MNLLLENQTQCCQRFKAKSWTQVAARLAMAGIFIYVIAS